MKTLVIAIGVLAITTSVYGFDRDRLEKFYTDLHKCYEEMGESPDEHNPEATFCASKRDGKLLDENGEFIKNAALKGLEDVISDPNKLKQAQDMYNKCHDEAITSKVTGRDQALKIITCFKPYLGLLDKL